MSKLESVSTHKIKKGDVISFEAIEETPKTYMVIRDLKTCKTGKHGSAKVMIVAETLADNKKVNQTLSGSGSVQKGISSKAVYHYVYSDGEEIYVTPIGDEDNVQALDTSDTEVNSIKKLKETAENQEDGKTIQFTKIMFPHFSFISDINAK